MTFKCNSSLSGKELVHHSIKTLAATGIVFTFPSSGAAIDVSGRPFDTIIKNGTVYDGTMRQPFEADIGVVKDKIAAIGKLSGSAKRTIDARGSVVAPGFIDVHTHCDLTFQKSGLKRYLSYVMPSWKGNYNYLYQGVTTVISGNCGYGYTDTHKWLKMVDSVGFGTNVYHLVPHGMIREELFGTDQSQHLTAAQMAAMQNRIAEELDKGALGMSTGLEYAPGLMATTRELIELSKVVRDKGGIYTTHMRDESGTITKNGNPAALGILCRHGLPG
jgi:N-acyl-D-aspartate/D-glutamate deacylase